MKNEAEAKGFLIQRRGRIERALEIQSKSDLLQDLVKAYGHCYLSSRDKNFLTSIRTMIKDLCTQLIDLLSEEDLKDE